MSSFTQGLLLGAGVAAAALLLLSRSAKKRPSSVFVLCVRIKLDAAKGGLVAFKQAGFPALAEHCYKHEPRTLSYILMEGEEDANEILIFERYATKADLTETHHASAPFKAFGAALAASGLVLSKSRETYIETDVGFMERA
jgi:quinol monooxygenase YgiN